jgi:hypothetical protein
MTTKLPLNKPIKLYPNLENFTPFTDDQKDYALAYEGLGSPR